MDERTATERDGVEQEFRTWVNKQPGGQGQMGSAGIVLKLGPRVAKTLLLSSFGNLETGEVHRRVLRSRQ